MAAVKIRLWQRSRFYATLISTWVLSLRPFVSLRGVCGPGLHCHGCGLATTTCPIGAIAYGGAMHTIPAFAIGSVLAVGMLSGRLVCAFVCPFGLLQDLLHRIPGPKLRLPRWWRWGKYLALALTVVILPALLGMAVPGFIALDKPKVAKAEDNKLEVTITARNHGDAPVIDPAVALVYRDAQGAEVARTAHAWSGITLAPGERRELPVVSIDNHLGKADLAVEPAELRPLLEPGLTYFCRFCPAGTLEASVPAMIESGSWAPTWITWVRLGVLAGFLALMWLASRPFCRGLCPLGASYALTTRVSLARIEIDASKCIQCGACDRVCPAELDVRREVGGMECIACGDCITACSQSGIRRRFSLR